MSRNADRNIEMAGAGTSGRGGSQASHPGSSAAIALALAGLLAGCSSGGSTAPAPLAAATPGGAAESSASPASDPPPAVSGGAVDLATFEAANFVDPTSGINPLFPLTPGTQWVREGTTEVGHRAVPHQVITTVTDVRRVIEGVTAVAVIDQDTDAGQITQESIDYMALDKFGNAWLVGSYTESFRGGSFKRATDAFLGSTGGKPGILVPGDPQPSTPRWFAGQAGKEAGGAAEVVEVGSSQCVPFSCYEAVAVIREGTVDAIDNEFKFYAPGVGLILNTPKQDSRHKDTEELVNLVQLSARGLSERSDEVLRLEAHARKVAAKVFGDAPESTRGM